MGKFVDLTDRQFNDWHVLEYRGRGKWLCRCKCGTEAIVSGGDLKNGNSRHCKNCRVIDLAGQQINEWFVLRRLENNKWLCRCSCGKEVEVFGHSLRKGTTINCGHNKKAPNFIDITGKTFGEWEVLEYLGNSMYKCQCSCGVIREVHSERLRNRLSLSCGHNHRDYGKLVGKTFGSLKVISYEGNGIYTCECSCGKVSQVLRSNLQSGHSTSCGHDKADRVIAYAKDKFYSDKNDDQRAILESDDAFKEYVISLNSNGVKPRILDLAITLNCKDNYIRERIHRQHLEEYVDMGFLSRSYGEIEVYNYITECYNGKILLNQRNIIPPNELDIYIPDKKLAIEFNGNYWHSTVFKDKKYHQNKSVLCGRKHIHLLHIFEYEWKTNKDKIKKLIRHYLCEQHVVYARKTEVRIIDNAEAENFCNEYHLQGGIKSSINLGLFHEDKLISVLTMGKSRFDSAYEYEILRQCTMDGIIVQGGLSKLLSYIKSNTSINSIVSYINLSKFYGVSYLNAGFKLTPDKFTDPGYVWVNNDCSVVTRYQAQKHKLVEKGLGSVNETENEIMERLGYYKVYDSGNIKLYWERGSIV